MLLFIKSTLNYKNESETSRRTWNCDTTYKSRDKTIFSTWKTDACPRKFVLQLLKHSVLKKLILRLNNYTTILAYVLLIEPIKGRVVFY